MSFARFFPILGVQKRKYDDAYYLHEKILEYSKKKRGKADTICSYNAFKFHHHFKKVHHHQFLFSLKNRFFLGEKNASEASFEYFVLTNVQIIHENKNPWNLSSLRSHIHYADHVSKNAGTLASYFHRSQKITVLLACVPVIKDSSLERKSPPSISLGQLTRHIASLARHHHHHLLLAYMTITK